MHAALQQHDRIGSAPAGSGGAGYRRHRPEDTVLYGVVEQHADAFFEGQVGKVEGCRDSFAKSLTRICVADVWNMVSFARNARDVVTSI